MKGSIRTITGLIIAVAAAGGLDNCTDAQIPMIVGIAALGLAIMYSGVKAMKTV